MRKDVRTALLFVLLEKICPRWPQLIRNDTKAAEIVEAYVHQMTNIYAQSKNIRTSKWRRIDNEASHVYFSIYPLEKISAESLRNYIRLLWKTTEIGSCIKIEFQPENDEIPGSG